MAHLSPTGIYLLKKIRANLEMCTTYAPENDSLGIREARRVERCKFVSYLLLIEHDVKYIRYRTGTQKNNEELR